MSDLYYTVTRNEIRPNMPAVPVLVSAAGWTVPNQAKKPAYRLRTPPLPEHVTERAADCGAFVTTTRWGGHYRFSPDQYVGWLMKFNPKWAATFDLCCVDMDENRQLVYPGKEEVERRQQFTTEMAHHFWGCYQELPIAFCPTIQGWHPEEYVQHARALGPLIYEMFQTYLDTGWTDEEQEQEESAFRVGVGSLCGRDPRLVHEIIGAIRAVIGLIPLHLWGTKLQFLRSPLDECMIASMDSAAWNRLWGENHEARRQSGLSEAQYCWRVSYPRYAEQVAAATRQPKFPALIEISSVEDSTLKAAKAASRVPLPDHLRYCKNGDGPDGGWPLWKTANSMRERQTLRLEITLLKRMKDMRDTTSQACIALAERLWQWARTNPVEIAEAMYTNDLAVEILRAGLDLYIQQMRSEIAEQQSEGKTLPTFLETVEPPLLLDLTTMADHDIPAQMQEQFGPGAVRGWSYCLSRGKKHIYGHVLASGDIAEEPTTRTIVRDLLMRDDIGGDDLMSESDALRLHTLFTEDEILTMRDLPWE